jgi:hypothetical protein
MITKKDIGRRVYVLEDADGNTINDKGTIAAVDCIDGQKCVAVEFDKMNYLFHHCEGATKSGYGWYLEEDMITFIDTDYDSLKSVLKDAEEQASKGKGVERHATNNKYEDQVICVVGRLLKDHPFGAHAYQVIKKTIEAGRLYKIKGPEAAYQEILGAINYCAAMNILIKEGEENAN